MLLRLWFTISLLVLVSATPLSYVTYYNEEHDITINYPDYFEPLEVEDPSVILALRHEAGFPTFNIVVQSGQSPIAHRSLSDQQREILTSYRLSGMRNARPLESFYIETPTLAAPTFVIFYSDSMHDFTSVVSLISASDRHFYLTTVGMAEEASESRELHQEIIAGFHASNLGEQTQVFSRNSRLVILATVFLIVLSLIIIIIRVKTTK